MPAGVHCACFVRARVRIYACVSEKTGNAFRHCLNELVCMTSMKCKLLARDLLLPCSLNPPLSS